MSGCGLRKREKILTAESAEETAEGAEARLSGSGPTLN